MKKKLSRDIYEFFSSNVILTAIIAGFPILWFSFLKIFGVMLSLYISGDILKPIPFYVTLFLFFVSGSFIVLKAIGEKYNITVQKHGNILVSRLLNKINTYKDKKCDLLLEQTKDISPSYDKYCLKLCPSQNMKELMIIMQEYIAFSIGIDIDMVGISLLYCYKDISNIDAWFLIGTKSIENDLSKEELIRNKATAAYKIINGIQKSVFFPSKDKAFEQSSYIYGNRDKELGRKGSIACYDIGIEGIHAVLSITTYGKQICENDDDTTPEKIRTLIIDSFANRLKIEFLIDSMNNCKDCHKKVA